LGFGLTRWASGRSVWSGPGPVGQPWFVYSIWNHLFVIGYLYKVFKKDKVWLQA